MKRAIQQAMRQGARASRSRWLAAWLVRKCPATVWLREGRVPLQTLRADVDFARAEARTTYGQIGVKVWIYKGEAEAGS